ncbi:pentapeptide repeat-containing protein [Vitiosangium sp. GDMCC 1.1324]|uniref:pentapeptide repeat-containing protein n=1 Tax=Vitiosangium sp. (strain GDMCC 1.1324) TaxID=2138576 RepID=UPI001E5DEAF8|nr:pentapeptide repeat-containing protein [Vitiosangium sp. GDMCC 1.1324]
MNIIYKNREMEDDKLELTDKTVNYYLGPNLTLRHCTIIVRVPATQFLILPTRFIDCTIEVKQELKNHQDWVSASLKGCRFTGSLRGCDFGHWPHFAEGWEHGAIEDCDFSQARLDACRFHGCDTSTLRFPPWPCFTFLDPIGRSRELNSVEWPGLFGSVVVKNLHTDPPSTVALTYHAPSVAKRFETTAEELKAVLEKLDGIVY